MSASRDSSNDPTQVPASGGAPDELPTVTAFGAPASGVHVLSGRVFGDYELQEELGRGGMGVVYRARQRTLDRVVALKMILPGPLANHEDLQRFRTEAEAAARLQHPNIVAVHGVGEVDGQHFYSMDFIDGPSLAQRLREGPLPLATAARYVMVIARAIHHAHRHNILHRDLKPSNILLDAADEPHVTDFGLAKKLGGDSGQTRSGAIMGTPSYMSPEQAAGKTRALGPACDVYGLGAILFELITGHAPFLCDSPLDTIQQVIEREPTPPRQLNPKIERDLETICLKCLQKDPGARYASALELADDLDRYLHGESISARNFNVIDRLARSLDRSHHAQEFRSWGTMLFLFAGIMFASHVAMFVLVETGQSTRVLWIARSLQFVLMALTFWRFRGHASLLPTNPAERQLWAIWIGYFLAFSITALVVRELAGEEQWDELALYPFSAVLSGMGFFVMGSSYWGRCYLVGLAFFGLAALMPLKLSWAPLGLGSLWGLALLAIALHVRQLSGEPAVRDPHASDKPTKLEKPS